MGFLDKAKEQAQKLGQQASDGVQGVQQKRKLDDLLGRIGMLAYLELTARGEPWHDAEIERLKSEVQQLETAGVTIEYIPLAAVPGAVAPPPPAP